MITGISRILIVPFLASVVALCAACNTPGPWRKVDSQPVWSPDGRKVVFVANRTATRTNPAGDRDIWIMDADGSNQRCLFRKDGDDVGPQWSPDGKSVMFLAGTGPSVFVKWLTGQSYRRILVVDLEGKLIREMTAPVKKLGSPLFHPDGEHLVWPSDQGLWLTDLGGENARRVCDFGLPYSASADWSRAVFVKWTDRGIYENEIWAADLGTMSVRLLARGYWFLFTPDGSTVLYQAAESPDIHAIGFASEATWRLTHCEAGTSAGSVSISPKGKQIVYAKQSFRYDKSYGSNRVIEQTAHIVGIDGMNRVDVLLPDPMIKLYGMRFRPDGRRLVGWCRPPDSRARGDWLCVINADGTNFKLLARAEESFEIHVSPDSDQILCSGGPKLNQGLYLLSHDRGELRRVSPDAPPWQKVVGF